MVKINVQDLITRMSRVWGKERVYLKSSTGYWHLGKWEACEDVVGACRWLFLDYSQLFITQTPVGVASPNIYIQILHSDLHTFR